MNSAQEERGRRGRSKRNEILVAATDRFGQDGYEHTKWADIAADIGVGATALYHYFESKQHCLYEIMDEAIADFHARFVAVTGRERDSVRAIEAVMADCFELSEHDVQRNRVLVAEQGRLSSPSASEREEQARQAARSRMRELEFAWASFLATAMRDGAIPETDPRLLTRAVLGLYNSIWHWYRPNGMLALNRVAEYYTELAMAIIGLPPGRAKAGAAGGMSFFERYFAALDGPEPYSSLELVSDEIEFAIEWANGEDRKATQLRGGRAELRAFIDAGDMDGWAHYVVWSARDGDTEFALGETRWDDGRFIGTFLAVAHLDGDGRMDRYMVGRSPAITFPPRSMHAELLAGTPSEPVLLGSECRECGTVHFPRQSSCPRCTSSAVKDRRLARRGTLWSWTVQRFRPKSPPYTGPEEFEPYGVGYIELPGEVRVEARLTEADPQKLEIGMEMELTLIPEATFAFRPVS